MSSNEVPIPRSERNVVTTAGRHMLLPASGGLELDSIDVSSFSDGDVVYITSDGAAALASCQGADLGDTINKSNAVGVVFEGVIVVSGVVAAYSGLIPGRAYFLSVDGVISTSPPTLDGQAVVKVGSAVTQHALNVDIDRRAIL